MDKINRPLISLCIPTNGVVEWVFPVLDSIYQQKIEKDLFEVVITDNGNNEIFKNKILDYKKKYDNLFYYKSSGYEFLSEPDSYKNAKGLFIKFVNHRTKFLTGTLQYLIDWVNNNKEKRPIVYFSNGVLNNTNIKTFGDFDSFVKELSYWSSWSTGMAFWKDDFDSLPSSIQYNLLFPHTTILFNIQNRNQYIVDDTVLLDEIPVGNIPKGKYNLFYAFAVEYMSILNDLYRKDSITLDTLLVLKKKLYYFIVDLYFSYILRKKKCSYDLSNYKKNLSIYFNYSDIKRSAIKLLLKKIIRKLLFWT